MSRLTELPFSARHIGPTPEDVAAMLKTVGYGSVEDLMAAAIPESIRWAGTLDLPPAATEAMTLARRSTKAAGDVYLVDADTLPQTLAVIRTRAVPLGIEVRVVDLDTGALPADGYFGLHVQYPGASGHIRDLAPVVEAA